MARFPQTFAAARSSTGPNWSEAFHIRELGPSSCVWTTSRARWKAHPSSLHPARRVSAAEAEQHARRALREHSAAWSQKHEARVAELGRELLGDEGEACPDQRLLVRLAAIEAALAEQMAELQVQILGRVSLLVDSPVTALKATKTLKEHVTVGSALAARVESLLTTASVLRAQNQLTRTKQPGLRAA